MFCLTPSVAEEFKRRVKSGQLHPDVLSRLTSEERHAKLAEFMGEDVGKKVNALFESKLLLKNQQQGMIDWIKQTAGLKPEVRKDMLARVERLDRVLSEKDKKLFLRDLAEQRLGLSVTANEAATITELARKVQETRGATDRLEHGRALVAFNNYISKLKQESNKLKLADFKANPVQATSKALLSGAGLAKSLKAALDNSAIFRQGLKVMLTHPKIWLQNSVKSFVDIARTMGGKEVLDEVNADILSRPNALNGLYKKEKLAIGTGEEAYPTSLPERIPGIGRLFKASQAAYTGFMHRTRADIFDKLVEIAKESNADIQGIGKLVNALTGRSSLGKLEPSADVVNNLFFAPRNLKSHFDVLTGHALSKDMSPFARKQAALNLVKIVSGIAGILTIAKAISPNSVEEDSRSADFGKIKDGRTRFDVSGGMSSLVTLASRLISNSSKNSVTKAIKPLNTGKFGSKSSGDVVMDFLNNKLSPASTLVRDLMNRRDRDRKPLTAAGVASNLIVPLPITNYQELKETPDSANTVLALIADALGIGTNTY